MPSASTAMGFCFFGNAAVAARHAQARWGLAPSRGGGFRRPPRQRHAGHVRRRPGPVLRLVAPVPCYPGTGAAQRARRRQHRQRAAAARRGSGGVPRRMVATSILPALDAFAPELLIVSAGFDAHKADPLAQLRAGNGGFRLDHRAAAGNRRHGTARAGWYRCSRAATTSTRWRRRRRCMSAPCCNLDTDPRRIGRSRALVAEP